jgi:hypothetical protein
LVFDVGETSKNEMIPHEINQSPKPTQTRREKLFLVFAVGETSKNEMIPHEINQSLKLTKTSSEYSFWYLP